MSESIYIHVIEGTSFWMPISGELVSENLFKITDTKYFDPEDTSLIPQFLPGDVVAVRGERAEKLIDSTASDREYWMALYGVVTERGEEVSLEVRERIRNEVETGSKWHYPAVKKWLNETGRGT